MLLFAPSVSSVDSDVFALVSASVPRVCNDFIMTVFVPQTNSVPGKGFEVASVAVTLSVVLEAFLVLELARAGVLTDEDTVMEVVAVV